jgi:hypothetical protein
LIIALVLFTVYEDDLRLLLPFKAGDFGQNQDAAATSVNYPKANTI